MDINGIQQPPTSTTLNSASSGNVVNGTPTCVASSSSSTHNRHPLILIFTPGGSEQWMRRVEMEFTPRLGMFFSSLAEAVLFHKDAHLQKLTRKLNAFHKQTIINNSKVNIGASTSFRLCKEDVKCFIGGKDAQMVIDQFKEISETSKSFYFAYYNDESQILSRLFWCDSQSRQNYSLFGDAVSFDATYGTNKYNLMFAPFTGVDHHKKSVTFVVALLEHEDEESFKWCLEIFLDAMNQKEPQCVVTDQAPGLILVVPKVFRKARHRFCMWHIMKKVTVKVGPSICKDTDFPPRFNSVVWDITLTRYAQICLDKDSDHSLPNLVSPLGIEKHASTVYTHAVFKEFQGEVETAIFSCGVVGVTHDIDHEYSEVGDGISGKIFRVVSTFANAHGTVDENVDATHYHNLAVSNDVPMTKDQEMEQLLGCNSSSTMTILPPRRAKNKGRWKRILSDKKKAIKKEKKPKRLCNNCKQMSVIFSYNLLLATVTLCVSFTDIGLQSKIELVQSSSSML
ncbi:uncharacterized protein LOC141590112 [Silene latifolia]|uniref:uncharacterized protein LOC141590112 n=1 Tax=Silene latifolia TaxID=37657 RepID=UPI003D783B1A